MAPASNSSLSRVPTPAERWMGILLSALIAIVCLGLFVLFLLMPTGSTTGSVGTLGAAAFFGLLGCAGLLLFYRAVFTKADHPSARALRIFVMCAFLVWAITIIGTAFRLVVHLGRAF